MTDREKQEIISEIEQSILEKMKGTFIREDTHSVLSKPRNKWFRESNGNDDSPMFDLFGTYVYWAVWDNVRKLTCFICGTSYVKNIKDTEFANEAAEILCATVYDLAKKYREKK